MKSVSPDLSPGEQAVRDAVQALDLTMVEIPVGDCGRPECTCTGAMTELHRRVDAYCQASREQAAALATECAESGHLPFRWDLWRVPTCSRCGAQVER